MNRAERLRDRLAGGESIDLRGHGKAGGGLVLAVQAFARAVISSGMDARDWPLFSSARKGATVSAFLRIARGQVENASAVTEPDIVVLVNEAAAQEVDFAAGTSDALYVVNTTTGPKAVADRYRLAGTVATVEGDALGLKHLNRPLANIPILAALVRATGLVEPQAARSSLHENLSKRRLPERVIAANLVLFDDALEKVRVEEIAPREGTEHKKKPFSGYGVVPVGAQAALRSSLANRTSGYGRPGVKVEFKDPSSRCNGCSLCVVQCPEGIIQFKPDPAKGPIVYGAKFDEYCKVCRECVTACPLDLFSEVAAVTRPETQLPGA